MVEPAPAVASSASSGASVGGASTQTTTVVNNLPEAPVYYTSDGIELLDNSGARWGTIVNQVPVGDGSTLTAIQIVAVLSRTDDNTFEIPTHAQYVTDVWFDNIKAEPTNHYYFAPDSTIITIASQGSGVEVMAFYLNKAEVT
jgi:hypothetical protein